MVGVLISLRATIANHQLRRASRVPLLLAGAFGLAAAVGTLLLGFVHHNRSGADILATVFALWMGGQVAQSALTGGASTLRPEMFALLPIARRRLAHALMVVGLADPVLGLLALAYAAVIPLAAPSGPAAIAIAVVATASSVALTSVLSTLAAGLLGPSSRRGRDAGTIVIALVLSVLALAGTLIPVIITALDRGTAPALSIVVRGLPSGWGPDAVEAATSHSWAIVAAALGGQLVLIGFIVAIWPVILGRRMSLTSPTTHTGHRESRRRRLPATPIGAVVGKELRVWARDPNRVTCLLIAVVVGAGVGLVPRITTGTTLLMPFCGPLTVVIAGACACNLYGGDGTSLWLTIMTPDSAPADVRGRQVAWLLLVGPFASAETVLLTAVSGRPSLWPWALSLLIALLGGAVGLIPLASLTSVQALDEAGSPTPAWSLKIQASLYAIALTSLATLAVLITGTTVNQRWLVWSAVPVAVTTGLLLGTQLARVAVRRLLRNQVDVLRGLVAAA